MELKIFNKRLRSMKIGLWRKLGLVLAFVIFIIAVLIGFYNSPGPLLEDIAGNKISFHSLKGKWVIINYWASWCKSCVDEIAIFNQFYQEQKNEVALFAVNYDLVSLSRQQTLIKKYDIHYPSLRKDPNESLHLGSISGVPVTFVFNPKGVLVQTLYGKQSQTSLKQAIAW